MSNLRSVCCNAKITYSDISADFIGDDPATMYVGTAYCICTKCHQPCNVITNKRKTWAINPRTRVKQDERKKIRKKIEKKEARQELDI